MSKHPAVHYARNYAAAIAPEVFANPMVALSSPDNLTNLTVREQVTFEVNLSGLAVGTDFIFNLNTSVLFPSAQFQASGAHDREWDGVCIPVCSPATAFFTCLVSAVSLLWLFDPVASRQQA